MFLQTVLTLALTVVTMAAPFIPIEEGLHHHQPFAFGYTVKDKHGEQHRQETGDGAGGVKGSYGFQDERGVHRQVNYVADKAGFRAEVKTNEHGTAPQDPAAVKMVSSAHPYFGGAGGKGVFGEPGLVGVGGHGLVGLGAHGLVGIGGPALLGAGLAAESYAIGDPFAAGHESVGLSGYAAPLLGGDVKGYDSRFGSY